jgi:gamma-glutamyltranspeptidase/glutathione hydrolase
VTDPAHLVCAPRWGRFGDRLAVEDGFAETEMAALQGADEVDVVPALPLRSAQQILHVRRQTPDVVAAADPRTNAAGRGI